MEDLTRSTSDAVVPVTYSPQKLSSSENPPVLSRWFLIVMLVIFPPLAWYLMYKDRHYHHWFPVLLYVYSGVTLLYLFQIQIFIIPSLTRLYRSVGIKILFGVYSAFPIGLILALILAVFGFVFGVKIKAGKESKLPLIAVIIFIVSYAYVILAVIYSFYPIYGLISSIK